MEQLGNDEVVEIIDSFFKRKLNVEAKDTIVSACKLCSSAEDQAKISFEAGRREGRREVVKWINSRHILGNTETYNGEEWQAQLKEWGCSLLTELDYQEAVNPAQDRIEEE